MSVYKRSDSQTYSYDFSIHGNRFSGNTGHTTVRGAKAFIAEEKARIQSQAIASPHGRDIKLDEALLLYWHEVGQHHVNADSTDRDLAWLRDHLGKNTILGRITDADVARLVAVRRGDGVGPATVNRTCTQVLRKVVLRAAKVWKATTPDINWQQHMLREPQERVREASQVEQDKFLSAVRPDYRPAIVFALLTGCRRAEIVGLTWPQVDWFNRTMTVVGKGNRSRVLPMTDAIYNLLWPLKDHHNHSVFTYAAKRARDGRGRGLRYPITTAGIKTEWRRKIAAAEIQNLTFHDLRHTFATRLLRESNLRVVQASLGHADPKTTARYAHVMTDDLHHGMTRAAVRHDLADTTTPTEITTEKAAAKTKVLKD